MNQIRDCMKDVSIIVATYNPSKSKLIDTLSSAVCQSDLDYEIIICDDSSNNECIQWCKSFFEDKRGCDYLIVEHAQNVGTCINVYDGVVRANGRFIKLISPGDFFIGTTNLKKWYDFALDTKSQITFSRIVNYYNEGNEKKIAFIKNRPVNEEIFTNSEKVYDQKVDYCYLSDTPVGAAYLTDKTLMKTYLEQICGRVKYAEDFMYRLAVLDNISIRAFPQQCIAYECNTGISTTTDNRWSAILDNDLYEINNIISESKRQDKFIKRYLKIMKYSPIKQKLIKVIFVRKYLFWLINYKIKKKKTSGIVEMLKIKGEI